MLTAAHPSPAHAAPFVGIDWHDLQAHRSALVRFARTRLQDPALAEDVVHDVFEAVLCGRARFGGRASLRSWLTAVLKHKIVDLIRERRTMQSLDATDPDEDDAPALAVACPQPGPEEVTEQRQRLARTLERIAQLPATLREVIQLRVFDEQATEAVCARLGISEQNFFVRLHRARRQLLA